MNSVLSICVFTVLVSTFLPVEGVGLLSRSDWGYGDDDGPSTWGEHYPVCADGERQSPIDLMIDDESPVISEEITFTEDYANTPASGTFQNNGHSVQFSANMPNDYKMTGGPLGEEEYQFLQLHFHWGSDNTKGSEHTVGGREYPLEMHMVHINSKYVQEDGTLDDGYATNADGLAVIGFLFKIDERKDYAPISKFTDAIADLTETDTSDMTDVDLGTFTKKVMKRGYFSYLGSLTTPGCNEVVTWINAKKYLKISPEQLDKFRETGIADNYRPPQPLNGRDITKGLSTFEITWFP